MDKWNSWEPTVPIMFDVHEVRVHPALPNVVVTAPAVEVIQDTSPQGIGREQNSIFWGDASK
jgi:hypothetical protein